MKIDYPLEKIKAIVFDVDGVLSPSVVAIGDNGEPERKTNIKDGYAIKKAVEAGLKICIITGARTPNLVLRYNTWLKTEIYIDCTDKLPTLKRWLEENGISPDETAYMGDDIPDLKCMRYVGLACAPYDACHEAIATASFVSKFTGGYGCARDLIEQIMRAQGIWKI